MYRRTLITALALAPLAACVSPTETALTRDERRALRIATFRVDPSGGAYRNGGPDYQNRIVNDLASALRREFSDRVDPSGWTMEVEVGVLDVVGGTATATGRGQSQLSATLRLLDETDALRASIPLKVTAGEARQSVSGTAVGSLTGSRDRFYRTLLSNYARDARIVILG